MPELNHCRLGSAYFQFIPVWLNCDGEKLCKSNLLVSCFPPTLLWQLECFLSCQSFWFRLSAQAPLQTPATTVISFLIAVREAAPTGLYQLLPVLSNRSLSPRPPRAPLCLPPLFPFILFVNSALFLMNTTIERASFYSSWPFLRFIAIARPPGTSVVAQ